jgi:hypothetical protein
MSRAAKLGDESPKPKTYVAETFYIRSADAAATVSHLFTLAHLNGIISSAKVPPLEDTPSTQAILLQERLAMFDREQFLTRARLEATAVIIDPTVDKATLRLDTSLPKDWKRFQEQLTRLENNQRDTIKRGKVDGWFSKEDKEYFETTLLKLETARSILDELYPHFCESPPRSRGQHGGMGLINIKLASNIFSLLPAAWREARVTKQVSAAKRYEIVRRCLGLIGENVSADAIRKALEKQKTPDMHNAKIMDGNGT